jgi:hypothetical protein
MGGEELARHLQTPITVEDALKSRLIAWRASPRHGHGTVLLQDHVRGLPAIR